MATVRDDLILALEHTRDVVHRTYCTNTVPGVKVARPPTVGCWKECTEAADALDRARAEPKTHHREDLLVALDELFDCGYGHFIGPLGSWDEWDKAKAAYEKAQSELSCPDICDTSCRCYQEGLEARKEPEEGCQQGHSVEPGMFSQTAPAEEAPDSVRVVDPIQLSNCIQFDIVQDSTGRGRSCYILPAERPYNPGSPMWQCSCQASGVARTAMEAVVDVRRHFWHNHADRRVTA